MVGPPIVYNKHSTRFSFKKKRKKEEQKSTQSTATKAGHISIIVYNNIRIYLQKPVAASSLPLCRGIPHLIVNAYSLFFFFFSLF